MNTQTQPDLFGAEPMTPEQLADKMRRDDEAKREERKRQTKLRLASVPCIPIAIEVMP